jgi:hypothetical protein
MVWHTTAPDGTKSVKENKSILQDNTDYIKTTMNIDHFWDIDSNHDGHHKEVQLLNQASNPTLLGSMNGVIFTKLLTSGVTEAFFKNSNGRTYQFTTTAADGHSPNLNITTYSEILTVPANSYGEIFIWKNGTKNMQFGTFMSDGSIVEGFSSLFNTTGISRFTILANNTNSPGTCVDLKLKGVVNVAGSYDYRIKIWQL